MVSSLSTLPCSDAIPHGRNILHDPRSSDYSPSRPLQRAQAATTKRVVNVLDTPCAESDSAGTKRSLTPPFFLVLSFTPGAAPKRSKSK
jgi:hypothetical protein